ncbi:DUF192 domain-containing protein [Kaustia mangrovi]|nr:DUF192 domain-containing protein [Kaustia mangrovi]
MPPRSDRPDRADGTLYAILAALLVVTAVLANAQRAHAGEGPEAMTVETVTVETAQGRFAFEAEIARTSEQQAKGLMFRRELGETAGMLFDFGVEREVMMWMRNTYIPLDMVFIKPDGTVHRIAENTTPFSERIIPSGGPVSAVLEVRAGTAERIGLEPGDRVRHRIFQ